MSGFTFSPVSGAETFRRPRNACGNLRVLRGEKTGNSRQDLDAREKYSERDSEPGTPGRTRERPGELFGQKLEADNTRQGPETLGRISGNLV